MSKEYEIAFKLGAQLESTFARTFAAASNDLKDLQKNVTELSKGKGTADTTRPVRDDLKQTRAAMQNTESVASKLVGTIQRAGTALTGVFAVRKIYGAGSDLVQTYAGFEQGLANVKAVSDATTEEMKALSAEAKKLGASTAWSAKEVTDAEMLLAQAGYSVKETIEALPGLLSLASADQIDLATATDIAAGTMQAFGLAASQATHVADVLALSASSTNSDVAGLGEAMKYVAPVSKALGIDVEQTAAAIGLLSNANIKASQAGTVLRAGLSRLASPTGESAKVINKLGIAAFDAQGTMLPLDQLIGNLRKSTEKLTDQQRADAISTIFGVEAMSGFLALMEQGPDKLRELTNELYKSEGAAKKMADTRLDSLTGSFVIMKSAIEGAKIQLGEKFAPTVRSVADRIANELPKSLEKFEKTYAGMVNSPEWINADWVDRIKIAWDQVISKPFSAWWQTQGKAEFDRVAGEMGKTMLRATGGAIKEALSFNGATSLLAAGALAIPGVKIGKGVAGTIKSLKSVGQAGTGAASGMGLAVRSAGMLGPAIGALANPIGLTLVGLGALGLGWVAYRKHQEKARQDLINMGDQLKAASSQYKAIADRSAQTKDLVREYRELSQAIESNVGTSEELVNKKTRLAEITIQLQTLYPQTISQYDAENGKIKEKLGLLEQESKAELELAKLRLEKDVAEKSQKLPQLAKEIANLEGKSKELIVQRDAYDKAYAEFKTIEAEYQKILNMDSSDERVAKIADLLERANKAGSAVGKTFGHVGLLDGTVNELQNKKIQLINEQMAKVVELSTAKDSYNELYNAQKQLIEMNLGAKLEEQAKKFNSLSDEEKKRFNEALTAMAELNKQMNLLPSEKRINIKVMYEQTGQPVPETALSPKDVPLFPDFSKFSLPKFGDGGITDRPSIFAERGLEAAIPIDNRPRSHALLERTNQLMGHSNDGGSISVTFSPKITIQGGAGDVQQQVRQALEQSQDDFERRFKEMLRQERRLGFR